MFLNLLAASLWLLLLVFPLLHLLTGAKRHVEYHPPAPPKLPIIGNLHQLGTLPHQSLAKLAHKYGPVMLLQFGNVQTVVVSSVEAAKDVMITRDADFCSRPPSACAAKFTYNYLDIAFGPYSDYWRKMKKTSNLELFSTQKVQSFRPVIVKEVQSLIDSIALSASTEELTDLSGKLYCHMASIVCEVAFGTSFKGSVIDRRDFQKLMHEAEDLLGSFPVSDFFPGVGWIADKLSGLTLRLERAHEKLDNFFQQLIEEHENPDRIGHHQEDFIDAMLQIEAESVSSGTNWFTKSHIKAILLNIFLGGITSSANTVIWAMTELARNPAVMAKAQDEIRSSIGGESGISEGDINKFKYLKMVLKETFRLHPPLPILPRETRTQSQIGNFRIESKTRVYVNLWAIGRDHKLWKEPEKFIPERFADSLIDFKGQHFELLPFGAGRRICPGMNMGLAMLEPTLAALLYWFNWELPRGMKEEDISVEEESGVTTSKKIPLKLLPVKYQ